MREVRILRITCVVALVLLGPLFTAGYLVGRGKPATAPQAQASSRPAQSAEIRVSDSPTAAPQLHTSKSDATSDQLHGVYLQVAATPKHQAFVDRLSKRGFRTVALEIPSKPGVYRVLVGPVPENALGEVRDQLDNMGLPGKSALLRTF